jgi:ATP-dependent DNA helicase RecQ
MGIEYDDGTWSSFYRHLIALGHLKMIMDGRSQIKLTNSAVEILEGNKEVYLRADYKKIIKKTSLLSKKGTLKKKTKSTKNIEYRSSDGTNLTLFENLKIFRTNLAKKRRTKSFKIFPNKTLMEMVENNPTELFELEELYGVGPKKLKKYGKIFLETLAQLREE